MFKLWKKLALNIPVFVLCRLFLPCVEVWASGDSIALKNSELKSRVSSYLLSNNKAIARLNSKVNLSSNLIISKPNNSSLFVSQADNIEQLQDLKPTDWSYEALKGLIERYGCIQGFENQTYRGEKVVSRAEFAAGLNTCLNKIEAILSKSDRMPQADVETVLRLMQEFQSDLAILQGRTDGAQARIEDLQAIQFSTTTKLQGEAVIGLGDVLSSDDETNTVLGSRLRLDFKTSFSGEDLLFTRLSDNNFPGFSAAVDSFQGNLSFADSDTDNFKLEELSYSFGVVDNLDFILAATGIDAEDIASTINVLDGDGGSGSISTFGTRNPIYNPPGDAGVGVVHRPIEQIEITAGYLASPANESSSGNGLFNGDYSALGQITIAPLDRLSVAATYVHSYNQSDTETGTDKANVRAETAEVFGESISTISNSYGLEVSWAISDRIVIGGWGGLSKVSNISTLNRVDRGTLDIWNWAATFAFPDLGKEGSMAGIVVGSEPNATNSSIDNLEADRERSLHLEAFYQYQLSDNIAITPGIIWITEPDSNIPDVNDLVIGTLRTTFSF